MSPIAQFSVLAFVSAVLASGHGHGHGHKHSMSAAPYPHRSMNSTRVWGTSGLSLATPSGSSSTQAIAYTVTGERTRTETVYSTIHMSLAPQSSPVVPAQESGYSGECGADVTVTSTEKVYVTVTAGSSSSAEISPAESSSARPTSTVEITKTVPSVSSSAPGYSAPVYSSEAAPVSTSSSSVDSAPAYTSSTEEASSSSSNAPDIIASIYSAINKGSENTASLTSSAAASYTSASSSSGGKRGLAYNDASLTDCFSDSSEISWAYNWIATSDGLTGYNYIPTLHSNEAVFTDSWAADAQAAIDSGSTHLFSFNEPDIASQANMNYAAAAQSYKDHMNQFAGKAQLCAPSVSNGVDPDQPMGLEYLQKFIDSCGKSCHIDCFNVHWYSGVAPNAEDFRTFVTNATAIAHTYSPGTPVWVSEFGSTNASVPIADTNSFLEEVMPWMDSNSQVAGYAYFMVKEGSLVSGTAASTLGNTYMRSSS